MNFINDGLYSMRNSVLNTSSMSLASSQQQGVWYIFDVGGKEFRAMKASLRREPNSILAQLVEEQVDPEQLTDQYGNVTYDHCSGRWQIDADANYFEYIIKYLRTGKFNDVRPGHTLQDLSDEAEALKLDRLVEICQQKILERQNQQQQFMRSGMSTPSGSSANYFYPNYPQGFFPPLGISPSAMAPKMAMGPPPGFGFESPRTDQSPSESTRSSQQMLPHQLREQFQPPPIATSTPEDKTGPPQPQLEEKVQQQQQVTNDLPAFSEEPPSLSTTNFDDENLGQFAIPARRPLNLNPLAETVMEEECGLEEEDENYGLEEYYGNENMEREENYGQNGTANNNWMGNADMWAESDEYATEALQQQNREGNYNGRSQSPQFGDYPDQLPLNPNPSYPDISSTIFIAPGIDANYRPLIDIETVTPTKMPIFEIQDGLLKNFKKIEKIRSNFIENFLYTLKEQNNLSEYRQMWRDKLGAVVFYLQRFYVRYPEGSTIEEFCEYEHEMKVDRDGHYDLVPTIPSLHDSDNPDALMTMDGEEIITIIPEVLTVHLFCIRQNLCSNLFRFLLRNPRKQGKDLLEEMKKLVPADAPPPNAEDLLRILNRYPAVFTLFFLEEQTNYTLEAGWIKLNEMLTQDEDLKWRIVLDCDVACMGVEFCDCGNCPDGIRRQTGIF